MISDVHNGLWGCCVGCRRWIWNCVLRRWSTRIAELYSYGSADNWLLNTKGSPSKGGEPCYKEIKICTCFDFPRRISYNINRKSVAVYMQGYFSPPAIVMVSWIISVGWLLFLVVFALFLEIMYKFNECDPKKIK